VDADGIRASVTASAEGEGVTEGKGEGVVEPSSARSSEGTSVEAFTAPGVLKVSPVLRGSGVDSSTAGGGCFGRGFLKSSELFRVGA
jgi:hypothetical protein